MTQFLRPDSNVTQTSWTNGFAAIDEVTASDVDFSYGANNSAAATLEVGLTNPTQTPGTGTCTVRWRRAKVSSGVLSGTGGTVTQTCGVYQGATLITSSTITTTGTWTESTFTFQASAVTNWNDLRLRFTQSASGGGGNARGSAVSWAVIEVPDASIDCTVASFTVDTTTTGLLFNRLLNQQVGDFALSGVNAQFNQQFTLINTVGDFALSGNNTLLLFNYLLNQQVGAFALSGLNTDLLQSLRLDTTAGSYLISNPTSDFLRQLNLIGNVGIYSLNGNNTSLIGSFVINVIPQSFNLIENTSDVLAQRLLIQNVGSYLVDGINSVLEYIPAVTNLDITFGSFAVTGGQLETLLNRALISSVGNFSVSSPSTTKLLAQRNLTLTVGGFSLGASIAEFLRLYSLILKRKQFSVNRINADLLTSRLLNTQVKDFNLTGIESGLLRQYPLNASSESFTLDGIGLDYFATRFITAKPRHFTVYVQDGTNLFIYQPNKQPLTPLYLPTKDNQWVFGSFTRMGRRFL